MPSQTSIFAVKFPDMPEISGVKISTAHSGMRYKKEDLLVAEFSEGTNVAGMFTKNEVVGEPIIWCRNILSKGKASALVVNSGYANVCVGEAGQKTIAATVEKVKQILGCAEDEIYIASTGIIGQPVKDDLLIAALESKLRPASWEQAAIAINTTDTFSKGASAEATIGGKKVKICGIVKGSGMIAPNMATMLGFVFTDAAIEPQVLQALLSEVTEKTYHAITVDSDTSTSDAVLAFATGKAGNGKITDIADPAFADFRAKFMQVNLELAKLVIKDGEGITKFITIEVSGAESDDAAKNIALKVANSPLVKTAMAGSDPNWGRIAGAVGNAGERVNVAKLNISLGNVEVATNGVLSPAYDERSAQAYMKGSEILVKIDVAVATGKAVVYTCDLSHGYISINADYRS